MLTQQELKQLVIYDPCTGVISFRKTGRRAGCPHSKGYVQIGVNGGNYFAHRLAWLYMMGQWPVSQIDHINGDRADNRWVNLRQASNAENCQNICLRSNNKCGFHGVDLHGGRYRAQIAVKGKRYHLGEFRTAEEASAAYVRAKATLHLFNPALRK